MIYSSLEQFQFLPLFTLFNHILTFSLFILTCILLGEFLKFIKPLFIKEEKSKEKLAQPKEYTKDLQEKEGSNRPDDTFSVSFPSGGRAITEEEKLEYHRKGLENAEYNRRYKEECERRECEERGSKDPREWR